MAYLNLFVFFMLTLVLGSSYPLMFVGWEGVGLCSYLLIGFWFSEKANADAGKKAFIVNRIGDFGFLMAMFLIFAHLGTLDFVEVFERGAGAARLRRRGGDADLLFLFLGAAGKSAQIPLYVWLPDAMAGPTPVSALIHAATMVTAGVYLVVRSSTLFAMAPAASLVVALVGALTAIFAATIGLKQWDIKKVLAYSTVSQLGFMFAAVGMGAYVAGVFHLMTHAFFKALPLPGLGRGDPRHAPRAARHAQPRRRAGHAQHGRAAALHAGHLRDHGDRDAGDRGRAALRRLLLQGRDHRRRVERGGGTRALRPDAAGVERRYVMGFIAGTLSIAALMTAFYMGRLMIYTFFGPNRTGDRSAHLHEGAGR
jgi:NADH-quinone oxidoreductase subunit L